MAGGTTRRLVYVSVRPLETHAHMISTQTDMLKVIMNTEMKTLSFSINERGEM